MAAKTYAPKWRTRSDGTRVAYWIAPAWAKQKGFPISTQRLWSGREPSQQELNLIEAACRRLRAEMNEFILHPERRGKRRRGKFGCVYFLRAGNQIKIGFTAQSVKSRLNSIQSSSGVKVELLGCVAGTVHHERSIHDRFAHLRSRGEWFAAADEIVQFISENAMATLAGNAGERGNVDADKVLK